MSRACLCQASRLTKGTVQLAGEGGLRDRRGSASDCRPPQRRIPDAHRRRTSVCPRKTASWPLADSIPSFEFCLFVPSTAATFEAGHAGRVYHRVVARAEGAGLMGADLRADMPVGIIAAPPENEASLLLNVEQQSEKLGVGYNFASHRRPSCSFGPAQPYSFGLSSSCLCVGGLVCVSFEMPAPPQPVIIDKIDLSVVQQFTISSLSRRSKHVSPFGPTFETEVFKPDRIRVMRLDGTNIGAGLNTTHAEGRVFTKEEERDDEGIARGELIPPPLSRRQREQEAAAKGKGRATGAQQAPTPRPLARLTAGEAFEVWHLMSAVPR